MIIRIHDNVNNMWLWVHEIIAWRFINICKNKDSWKSSKWEIVNGKRLQHTEDTDKKYICFSLDNRFFVINYQSICKYVIPWFFNSCTRSEGYFYILIFMNGVVMDWIRLKRELKKSELKVLIHSIWIYL